ncbi:mitochondrial calcium uniporter regulator 1 isoform X2 [Pleurodeles waltl]|uniref:mitochondrial calcium uniporter regulator 1 isoform X2 n=1 Tax=Pleurodeles waltl TaxID=8319 RepID=UPI0037094793
MAPPAAAIAGRQILKGRGCSQRRVLSCKYLAPLSTYSFLSAQKIRVQTAFSKTEFHTSSLLPRHDIGKGDYFSLEGKKLFFDTHALVRHLEMKGFTTQQSEILESALMKIINHNMDGAYKDMVTKLQQKVKMELMQLKKQLTDEIVKVRAENNLDFNLQKSRVKEMYADSEKKLLEARTEIIALHAQQDRALTQINRKIDTEVAGMKTMQESHKLDTIKYLAGSVFTCLTIVLGFYRLWM